MKSFKHTKTTKAAREAIAGISRVQRLPDAIRVAPCGRASLVLRPQLKVTPAGVGNRTGSRAPALVRLLESVQ